MKVINEITEEFMEAPENRNELMVKEMNAIMPTDIIQAFKIADEMTAKLDQWKKDNKTAIMEVFKKYGFKSFKNDEVSITYKAPYTKKIVDTAKLKADGVYDFYSKESQQAESLQITYKKHD